MNDRIKRLATLAILPLTLSTSLSEAAPTSLQGSSGGGASYSLNCSQGQRVTGVEARHGNVIERIRLRCTPISANGTWSSTLHSMSTWTASDSPQPAPTTSIAECGQHSFVRGFQVYMKRLVSGQSVIAGIELACHASNASLGVSGNATSSPAIGSISGGTWLGWATCPNSALAHGASGQRGWYLDSLQLQCTDPVAAAVTGAPTAAPQLLLPKWSSGNESDSYGAVGNWKVRLTPVATATRYQICVRDSGSTSCFVDVNRNANTGANVGGGLEFTVSLPAAKAGTVAEWTAQACNDSGCGPYAAVAEKFTIVPVQPMPTAPPHQGTVPSRQVTFSWQAVNNAYAGYQLIVWKQGSSSGYNAYNPTQALPSGHVNLSVGSGVTSQTVDVPAALGTSIAWEVRACADFTGKGRRCSLYALQRIVSFGEVAPAVLASFTSHLLPSFHHARCINCHGVNAIPSTKPSHNIGATCSDCHNLGGASNWHPPPATMDFRGKTAAQLCQMTKTLSMNISSHLKNDTLILWAVNSGQVRQAPNSAAIVTLEKAPPSSTTAWHQKVDAWIAGGMSCN